MGGKSVNCRCPDQAFEYRAVEYCAVEYCPRQAPDPHPIPISGMRPAQAENDRLLE
ncbi:MAG TPA: hypothetical protein VNA16_04370 [Abditibacteriaceae bacterium]|nr:hypothetical protein [Abditibacteriaceae bacterium]